MENASKALIIAGAILLAILIISLGLIVYNQAKETVGSVNLSQQEIEAFNAKFTSFEGTDVSGSRANQLIQTVIASNQQAINDNTGAYVAIGFECEGGTTDSTAYKYLYVGVSGDEISYYSNGALKSAQEISEMLKDTFPEDGSGTSPGSVRVVQGKKYDVTMAYDNGRISGIQVK